jgi:hypothetical protein
MKYQLKVGHLSQDERRKIIKKLSKKYKGIKWWSQSQGLYTNQTFEERFEEVAINKLSYLLYTDNLNYIGIGEYQGLPEIKLNSIKNKLK